MSATKRDDLSTILRRSYVIPERRPNRGESSPIARWQSDTGLGAALFVRHRRDGELSSELVIGARSPSGSWSELGLDSGAAGYPDVYTLTNTDSSEIAILGFTSTWISESTLRGHISAPLRLLELRVGASVSAITCVNSTGEVTQEISPLRVALVGAWTDEPSIVQLYARSSDLRIPNKKLISLDLPR